MVELLGAARDHVPVAGQQQQPRAFGRQFVELLVAFHVQVEVAHQVLKRVGRMLARVAARRARLLHVHPFGVGLEPPACEQDGQHGERAPDGVARHTALPTG